MKNNYKTKLEKLAIEMKQYFDDTASYRSENFDSPLYIKCCKILDPEYKENKVIDIKPNKYDKQGILKNMDVWDWIVIKEGYVRQIISDDMMDLQGEDIVRYAKDWEIKFAKQNEEDDKDFFKTEVFDYDGEFTKEKYDNRVKVKIK